MSKHSWSDTGLIEKTYKMSATKRKSILGDCRASDFAVGVVKGTKSV